jgi:hypothetical protein
MMELLLQSYLHRLCGLAAFDLVEGDADCNS